MDKIEDIIAPSDAVCGGSSASAYLFAVWNLIVRPPRSHYTEAELAGDYPRKRFSVRGQPALRSDFEVANLRGMRLVCSLFEPLVQGEGADARRGAGERACVIFCHDSCSCRLAGFQLVPVLLPLNISVACFDFAGSGRSGGEHVSFGFHERDDLSCVIDYLRRVYGFSRIALWGQTMGAAAALMHAPRDPTLAGVVADSPFVDVWTLLTEVCSDVVGLPPWLISPYLHMVRLVIQNKAGFDICDVSPEAHAKKCFIPALFLHGDMNTFVAPHHTERLQRSYGGEARILTMPGVAHSSRRPSEFLAKAAAFLVRALRWERHLPPGVTEATLAELAAGTLPCSGRTGRSWEACPLGLPPRGVLQLLAAPGERSRCLGLVRAACELCSAYRGAHYLSAALPGGKEAASPYRTASCPCELRGRVTFLAEGSEMAFCWVREGAVAENRAPVAFAVLSPTAVSIARVAVLRRDAEPGSSVTLGSDSLAGLECEPVETLNVTSVSLVLRHEYAVCLRVSEHEASLAVGGLTVLAPMPGKGRLHLWCMRWTPGEATSGPRGTRESRAPAVQLELGGEVEVRAAVAVAPTGEEALLDSKLDQISRGKYQLLPSGTLPLDNARAPSREHLAESLAKICYGMRPPQKLRPGKIEAETQTSLKLTSCGSRPDAENEWCPQRELAAAAAAVAAARKPPLGVGADARMATGSSEAISEQPPSLGSCAGVGSLPRGHSTCPPGLQGQGAAPPPQQPLQQGGQRGLDDASGLVPANGTSPTAGSSPPGKGVPPAGKGAPPAKGTPPPSKGATLPAKGTPPGKGAPPSKGVPPGKGSPPGKGAPPGKGKGKGGVGGAKDAAGREPLKPDVVPRVPLKRLFWTPISLDNAADEAAAANIWERVHHLGADFDRDELEALFAKGPQGSSADATGSQASEPSSGRKKGQLRRMLEEQRRRQVWCMLAKLPEREVMLQAIVAMDDSVLMPDKVDLLLANLPAPPEESALRAAATEPSAPVDGEEVAVAWDAPEAFLIRLVEIPVYALRVKAWAFLNAFESCALRLSTAEADCRRAGEQLRTSERIERMLAVILHVGNYLNGGTPRGRADGFELDSLTKLGELKTNERSSLVDFIVGQMGKDYPGILEEILAPGGEYDCIHRARRHKMKELREDLSSLLGQAEDFSRRMERCVADGDSSLERPHLRMQAHVAQLKDLEGRFNEFNDLYAGLCTWFRIDTGKKMPTEDFFGIWDAFLTGVSVAREASGRRRQQGSRASSAPAAGKREEAQEPSEGSARPRRQPSRRRSQQLQPSSAAEPGRPPLEGRPPAPRAGSTPPMRVVEKEKLADEFGEHGNGGSRAALDACMI